MTARLIRPVRLLVTVVTLAVVTACGAPPPRASPPPIAVATTGSSASPATSSPPPVTASPRASKAPGLVDIDGTYDVGGRTLWISCFGSGSPTVVFEAGLGGGSGAFQALRPRLAARNRACFYNRASIGPSQPRPEPRAGTPGQAADDLIRLLAAAGIDDPIVLVAHSYGGAVARLAAQRAPDRVHGLVLVDSVSMHQFDPSLAAPDRPWRYDPGKSYLDGSTIVDREATATELAAMTSFGSLPLAVLTQGRINGAFEEDWSSWQDELATLSTNALHVVARDSGHVIQDDAPDLVVAVIQEVIKAAQDGSPLPPCGASLEMVGATCLASTMTARLAAWHVIREAVRPTSGSFPAGTYRAELTGEQSAAATGEPADFRLRVLTWTIARGRWTVSIVTDGGTPETITDIYASAGREVTLRIPDDSRIPGTPGVNRLRWTRDKDGTVHFEQIDGELREDSFVPPWTRVGDASGG